MKYIIPVKIMPGSGVIEKLRFGLGQRVAHTVNFMGFIPEYANISIGTNRYKNHLIDHVHHQLKS